jgi:hypothetical protein
MKSTRYDQTPVHDERLVIAVPAEVKRHIFAIATKRGMPASVLIRQALAALTDEPRAA